MPATLVLLYKWRRALMIAITILFVLLIFAQTGRAKGDTVDVDSVYTPRQNTSRQHHPADGCAGWRSGKE